MKNFQLGALDRAVILCRNQLSTTLSACCHSPSSLLSIQPPSLLPLLLRLLTVLCSTPKGCLEFLTIGGVDVLGVIFNNLQDGEVLRANTENTSGVYCDTVTLASVELFAQLSASLVRGSSPFLGLFFEAAFHHEDRFPSLPLFPRCVQRLLLLIDGVHSLTESGKQIIFCCASALDNIYRAAAECDDDGLFEAEAMWFSRCFDEGHHSLSKSQVISRLLYEHNAPPRLIRAGTTLLLKGHSHDDTYISVQEHIISIFSRMASIGYVQSLICQKVIPFLLQVILVLITPSSPSKNTPVIENVFSCNATCEFAHQKGLSRRQCRSACVRAATCLVQLTRNSAGLKALTEVQGDCQLAHVLSVLNDDGTNEPGTTVSVAEKDAETATLKLICDDLIGRMRSSL